MKVSSAHMSTTKPSVTYPMIPKTTSNLLPGAFWGIPLESGRYGCGVVLDVKTGSRTALIVGLTDYLGQVVPDEAGLKGHRLLDQGQAHIKSILHSGRTILGRIDLEAYRLQPVLMRDSHERGGSVLQGYRRLRAQSRADSALPVMSTWGYSVIVELANDFDEKHSSRK